MEVWVFVIATISPFFSALSFCVEEEWCQILCHATHYLISTGVFSTLNPEVMWTGLFSLKGFWIYPVLGVLNAKDEKCVQVAVDWTIITCIWGSFIVEWYNCRFGWIPIKPHYQVLDHPNHCRLLWMRIWTKVLHLMTFGSRFLILRYICCRTSDPNSCSNKTPSLGFFLSWL